MNSNASGLTAADFDFALPDELIALRPAVPRDASRLLAVRPGAEPLLADRSFNEIGEYTKVIPARLHGERRRGAATAKAELLLTRRESASAWLAMARPAKRMREGDTIIFAGGFQAEVAGRNANGEVRLEFALAGPELDQAIAAHGELPLPPYIAGKRAVDAQDARDYQTVYARVPGAIAAPTAGLHFTGALLKRLDNAGIESAFVTLHVGAGTFLPVKSATLAEHRMHAEWGEVIAATAARLNDIRARGGRVVAVGTTSLRLLETAARARPEKLEAGLASDPANRKQSKDSRGAISEFRGETGIFITPGYRFRAVDLLITNFHLPRSTLFMLVSAFSGFDAMKKAYRHAISNRYRFYSYGDASLLFPGQS